MWPPLISSIESIRLHQISNGLPSAHGSTDGALRPIGTSDIVAVASARARRSIPSRRGHYLPFREKEKERKRERERERERGKTQIHMRGFVSLPNGPMSNQVGFDRKSQKLKKRDSCLTRVNMTLGRTFERQIVSSSALSCSKKLDVFKNIQKLNERKSSSVHCWLTSIRSDTFFLFVNGEK